MPITRTFPFQLLSTTDNARFFSRLRNESMRQCFLPYPSSNPRTTTSETRSADNSSGAGPILSHYVSNRKFDIMKKIAAAIGVRRTDRQSLSTHNDVTQNGSNWGKMPSALLTRCERSPVSDILQNLMVCESRPIGVCIQCSALVLI